MFNTYAETQAPGRSQEDNDTANVRQAGSDPNPTGPTLPLTGLKPANAPSYRADNPNLPFEPRDRVFIRKYNPVPGQDMSITVDGDSIFLIIKTPSPGDPVYVYIDDQPEPIVFYVDGVGSKFSAFIQGIPFGKIRVTPPPVTPMDVVVFKGRPAPFAINIF